MGFWRKLRAYFDQMLSDWRMGDGGAVVADNDELAERVRMHRAHERTSL
jgi:hypothetical protein